MTWHITYATHIKCRWNWNRHYQSIKNNKLYGTHFDCMCVRLVVWRSKCLHQRSTTQNKPTHKNSLQTQSFNMIKTYTVYNPIIIMVSQVCNAHTDITSIYNQFLEMGSIALHLLLLFEVHVSVLFMLFCRLWPTIARARQNQNGLQYIGECMHYLESPHTRNKRNLSECTRGKVSVQCTAANADMVQWARHPLFRWNKT